MPLNMPAVDANLCSGWSQQDINLYNKLPFYLAKMQVDRRKDQVVWPQFLDKGVRWTPNMGSTMRSVRKVMSPHIRQFANPLEISLQPRKDVTDIREVSIDEQVCAQDFESPHLSFVPEFRDFLRDHIDVQAEDIMEKQERFEDIFYRSRILGASPYVALPGDPNGTLRAAPVVLGAPTATSLGNTAGSKTTNWLTALLPDIINSGLKMEDLNIILTAFENDIGALPFNGPSLPVENKGLTGKFCLVLGSEDFNQFSSDPWLLAYKNCALDVINGRFQGNLFGRITCRMEQKPLRFQLDGTFPAPETREGNANAYNYGETIPNPSYFQLNSNADANGVTGSPYSFAFLVGAAGYDVIDVGPPPAKFASTGMPQGFGKMQWNGEINWTKNILIPCVDDDGTQRLETNKYGRFMMAFSSCTYGIRRRQPRFILPIPFKRKRGK